MIMNSNDEENEIMKKKIENEWKWNEWIMMKWRK